MKNYIKVFLAICILFPFSSCNQDIDKFDNSQNFIYFNTPYELDQDNKPTKKHLDSIVYSFALEPSDYKEHRVDLIVNTISLPTNSDREYSIEVVEEETTATDSDWDRASIGITKIKKGNIVDTLHIKLKRSEAISIAEKTIVLRIKENENFKFGEKSLLKAKICFSDILQQPKWWNTTAIRAYVGVEFHREILVKWMEIYYLGADPNTESITYAPNYGQPLWWGNMPYSLNSVYNFRSYYPSTVMFFGVLKKYFDENEVYPNGDTSKPRIILPQS